MIAKSKNTRSESKKKNNYSGKKTVIEIEDDKLEKNPTKKNSTLNKEYLGKKREINNNNNKLVKVKDKMKSIIIKMTLIKYYFALIVLGNFLKECH